MIKADIYDKLFKGAFVVRAGSFDTLVGKLKSYGFDTATMSAPRLAKTMFCEHSDGRCLCVLWFSTDALDSKAFASVIAHEVHHAAWWTLESRGVSAVEFAGETGAYYTEWLMAKVIQRFRAASKSRKKR